MQAINAQTPRSLLMVPLLGSALGGVALVVVAVARPGTPRRWLLLADGLAAMATMVITGIHHVPHNDALALLPPDADGTAPAWAGYASGWVAWNHVRAVTALASGLALVARLVRRP